MLVQYEKRYKILLVFFLFLTLILISRLFFVSIAYKHIVLKSNDDFSMERGKVFDRSGKLLADNYNLYMVIADPYIIKNVDETAKLLEKILDIPVNSIISILNENKAKRYLVLDRNIKYEKIKELLELSIKGVYYRTQFIRSYPMGEITSSILGYVDQYGRGLDGLEFHYNGLLQEKAGNALELTLDTIIQYIVWDEIRNQKNLDNADWGLGLCMNAKTGEILADVVVPSADPLKYADYSANERLNKPFLITIEPGSTFKTFIMAALFNENKINYNDTFYCEGEYHVTDTLVIRDAAKHNVVSMEQIMRYSCNVGIIKAAESIPKTVLYKYIRLFNFGNKTGVDFPAESSGLLKPPNKWTKMTRAIINIGHEVGVTPLQLITAFNAVVNGGILYEPKIVKKEIYHNKQSKNIVPFALRKIINEQTSDISKVILQKALIGDGSGRRAYTDITEVGGKTGTAQVPSKDGYFTDIYITSFLGYFMFDSTPYTVYIAFYHPKTHIYGGVNAAPVFKNIVERVYNYMTMVKKGAPYVSIDRSKDMYENAKKRILSTSKIPDFTGLTLKEVLYLASELSIKITLKGSGFVYYQSIPPGTDISANVCEIRLKMPEN